MNGARELLQHPLWRGEHLGRALPEGAHSVSVALPRWQDVVGYEEKNPAVVSRLACGYPRFVVHPIVEEVARRLGGGQSCLPLPSRRAAEQCVEFIRRQGGKAERVTQRGLDGVVTDPTGYPALRAFWQHTGLILSSRQAEAWLAARSDRSDAVDVRRSLRRQLAAYYDCAEDDVFLAPTGMAAQFAALRIVMQRAPERPTVQLGFPYVDTLKLQQKFGHGGVLLHRLDTIADDLAALLERQPVAACFGEIPGNPLLGSADLRQIRPLLRARGVPFIADDVVATPFNIGLSDQADLIATSLTKYIVGTAEAMGGALICPPRSPWHAELKAIAVAQHEVLFWGEDVAIIEAQARDFPERMAQHNANGLFIAERLRAHPAVERVWYPKWEFNEAYDAVRRPKGGWGSLVTFLPKNAETRSPRIFDALAVSKGPSLGTIFTLACPFTLLAHYTELEWAESCGVSRHLIRVSVGLEEPAELWDRFAAALAAPKQTTS